MKKRKILVSLMLVAVLAVSVLLAACDVLGDLGGLGGGGGANTVEFYAINDFHGEWNKMAQVSGYLAEQKAGGNTVLINSGDMFQGSMESNSNYGALLAECMDDTGFDSFTYGNHEFDWGLDNLRTLAGNSQTPYLGANIYDWNRSTGWGELADFAQEYVIKELNNGLKVGIIGVIGKDQITSISSQLVQTIGFKDPAVVVPELSEKLRDELGCDIVVVSAHTGRDTFLDDNSWDITAYADAVFCAHTHRDEKQTKNGVPFIQGGSYGNYVSHVTLTVDGNGNVTCKKSENIAFSSRWPNKYDVGEKIDNSNESIKNEANQVLATLNGGYLNSQTGVPRLVCHAIAEYAQSKGYDIDLAMVNNARNSLQQGNVTYTALYEAIPFDNIVYVAKVIGADILNEAKYDSNSIWRVSGKKIESNEYYYIAVIDYLLYHQNSNRQYNYFPSAFTSGFDPVPLTKAGVSAYNYRLITRDFLLSLGTVAASNYINVNNNTNKNLLSQTINLSLVDHATTLFARYKKNILKTII
ncbi:MAG: bifunctional metallophosphatase/5'-nucleotidase [Clostridiales bacterium]|nr:bifunctional metallophosphatase/5'-nucleotidase [Clostridiales bacterium]